MTKVAQSLPEAPSVGTDTSVSDESESLPPVLLIAVMGVTGSGKSNFLRLLTGRDDEDGPQVGHSLGSCTQKTEAYECLIQGQQFVFFDTPGFDDTYRGDADILADVAQALSSSYMNNVKLSGIIYLHRIKDERMTNAIMRNLTMFRNLCGDGAFENVILATTFWDELQDESKGAAREHELISTPEWWGYMSNKGSRIRRFQNTRESALEIVNELVDLPAVTLQIQEEIVEQGLGVDQTTAGEALNEELNKLREQHQTQLNSIREEKEQAIKDRDVQLEKMLDKLEQEKQQFMRRLESEQAALHADRREQQRRMEQAFNDQLVRLERERKAREAKIQDLETRLSTERADANERFQAAMAESNRMVSALKLEMEQAREEDRAEYDETIRKIEERQRGAVDEAGRWRGEVERLNRQIRDASTAQVAAHGVEKRRMEARIRELEQTRNTSNTNFWDVVGNISNVATGILLHLL
ncbi:hypothetical protein FOPG_08610 [Fusarium oxysporum f. sp. conglutinans race 2 54008]|uniref:G domain-containing protein n=1 Tax=Fusarium oxysporum f. sp. conglutinans race 2 54008 TaxID=1089457 RepID=X0HJX4_FUSOX|nr:hypothetical protein FOPG_08610 [Fusarium oxysporum f. sp. conglutinans race 2 54008]KAG6978304.1 hypothetical protein FocnCong_v011940 [Fusarium oxysporum f. sp. conglutinans]